MSEPPTQGLGPRIAAVRERLEVLWTSPEALKRRASWLSRLWLRVSGAGRGPRFSSEAMRAFREDAERPFLDRWDAHRAAIVDELEENVVSLERSATVDGEAPAPLLTWLFGAHRWVAAMERSRTQSHRHAQLALTRGLASRVLLGPAAAADPGSTITLAGVDALLDEAAQETERLSRRRHFLEAARRLLIEAEATASDPSACEERRALIAEELLQLSRMEAAGIDPSVGVSHQIARSARRRRSNDAATACAAAMYLGADRASEDPLGDAATALTARLPEDEPTTDGLLPQTIEEAVERGYRRAREQTEHALGSAGLSETLALRRRRQHLSVDAHLSLLRMALGVDGVFDVGGRLERERLDVVSQTVQRVPFPTQELELHPVQEPRGVRDAIIEDPRLLLYHLATRRLLQRRYVHRTTTRRRGSGVRAAVRFYLLDGSTSMQGARARMRDAILVAELASHVSRLERPGGRIRSLLYYRYFNSETEVTRRIATIPEALEAIEEVLGTMRTGRTDIEGALLDSLELIARNRDNDVELSRAQVVLVTDGAAPVDAELIVRFQTELEIPVRVSVIALGDENAALQRLAVEQREAGLSVLYHHVSDDALARWESGWADEAWPSFAAGEEGVEAPDATLEELASLADARTHHDEDEDALMHGLREVGLDGSALGEGAWARLELARRDVRSLRHRFERLFALPERAPESLQDEHDHELTVVLDALAVVSEVLALSATDEATAMSDAIAIFERLLRDRGLSPDRYLALAAAHEDLLGPALQTVRAQVRPSSRAG